jgi:hypothetical protein
MYAGMFCDGFFSAFMFVPIIPELIATMEEKEIIQRKKEIGREDAKISKNPQISDKASALFNISYAIGAAIAPVIGGGLYDKVGFQSTADLMAATAICFSLIFFISGALPHLCKPSQKNKEVE